MNYLLDHDGAAAYAARRGHITVSKVTKYPLYGCPGCGYPTTGSVGPVREYDSCPDCIERATAAMKRSGEPDDDPGPWRERGPMRRCPKCGSRRVSAAPYMALLACNECDHEWVPRGVYANEDELIAQHRMEATR